MKFCVYGLFDPRNDELRYVGYTGNVSQRLQLHCRNSKLIINNHKNNWIKSLKKINLLPQLFIFEKYNDISDALNAEIDLIAYFRSIGCDLTNATHGGEEAFIYPRSEESRLKTSIASTGRKHTAETKARISNSLKGIKRNHSEEHKKKISESLTGRNGSPKSEETKEKLRLVNLGRQVNDSTKVKAVKNNKSYKLTKENIIEIKELYTNNFSKKKIAELFNISVSHVWRIVNNQTGKYL